MELCPCYEVPAFPTAPPPEPWVVFGQGPPNDWLKCPRFEEFLKNNALVVEGNGSHTEKTFVVPKANTTTPGGDGDGAFRFDSWVVCAIVGSVIGVFLVVAVVVACRYYHCLCCAKKKSASKHMLSSSSSASSGGDRVTHWTYDYMRPLPITQSQMTLKDHSSANEMHYASTEIYSTDPSLKPVSTVLSSPPGSPSGRLDVGFRDGSQSMHRIYEGSGSAISYPHNYETIESIVYGDTTRNCDALGQRFRIASSRH